MANSDRQTPMLRNRDGLPPTVLLVEDETLVALMLRHALEELGCQVVGWAVTAEDAERLAARTPPDLILMDIRLKGQRASKRRRCCNVATPCRPSSSRP